MPQSDDKNNLTADSLLSAIDNLDCCSRSNEPVGGRPKNNAQNLRIGANGDEEYLQDLIARIVKQDQAAFSALFKAMSARVYSLALRITGNKQLAEEATEDSFFQVWRQAPRFDPAKGTAKAWILTIARSRALDAWRSIPPFDSQEDYEMDERSSNEDQRSLQDFLSAFEQHQELHKAVASLEPVPRQLIALSFFKGLSHEEIANHAELPLGTVKSHLRRAILHLKTALTTDFADTAKARQ